MARQLKNIPKKVEIIKIWIVADTFSNMIREGLLSRDQYELIAVEVNGEEYPDDPQWVEMRNKSHKAYKQFKKYTYEKRQDKDKSSTTSPQDPA